MQNIFKKSLFSFFLFTSFAFPQTDYFDFGNLVTYLPGNQCYGVHGNIEPLVKTNGDIICFFMNEAHYPTRDYHYLTINSSLTNASDAQSVFGNQHNNVHSLYMDNNYVYLQSLYQTRGRDPLVFTKYNISTDSMEPIGEKSWWPTGAISDNHGLALVKAPNGKFYLANSWRYVGWWEPKEDVYMSVSDDTMKTWSDWIGGGHIEGEGNINDIYSSMIADQNSNLYLCMNTTWGGDNVILYVFDPVQETFTIKTTIDSGFGGTIYLNQNTGKLAIVYIQNDKPTVRYSNISDPSSWSSPTIIDNNRINAIDGMGNTGNGGIFDRQNYFYIWSSQTEQYVYQWDGDANWSHLGLVPKTLNENYDEGSKVISDENGNPIIFQGYINDNEERFVHVKRMGSNYNISRIAAQFTINPHTNILCDSENSNAIAKYNLTNAGPFIEAKLKYGYINFDWLVADYPAGVTREYVDFEVQINGNVIDNGNSIIDTMIAKRVVDVTAYAQSVDTLEVLFKYTGGGDAIEFVRPVLELTDTTTTSIDNPRRTIEPTSFSLKQNYPNPFNPTTTIEYSLPKSGAVQIDIFNNLGQKVRSLVNKEQIAGSHSVTWDGMNDYGQKVATGVFYYSLRFDGNLQTKQMILIK